MSFIALFDLIGAVGFLVAFAYSMRNYREQRLFRSYWLLAATATGLLALWSAMEVAQWSGVASLLFDNPVQILVMTTALTALILLALYDNTENENVLRQLAVSERLNREIISHYPDGAVVLFDADRSILTAGGDDLPGAETDGGTLAGQRLDEAFVGSFAEMLESHWTDALAGETATFELECGAETYSVRTLPAGAPSERPRGLMVVQNVTEQTEREQTLREQRNELETLDRINQVIRNVDQVLVGARTREEAEREVCQTVAGSGPYRFAVVAEFREGDLHARAWAGVGEEYVRNVFPVRYTAGAKGPSHEAVETWHTTVFTDLEPDPDDPDDWRHHARDMGYRSIASVPIKYRDTQFGILGLYSERADAFDERERAVLDQLGETMGYALTAIQRKERIDVLAALHSATEELLIADSADAVADIVGTAAEELLGVEIAVFGYDDTDHRLRPLTITDEMADFYGEEPTYWPGSDDSITWETFVSGDPAVYDDLQTVDSRTNPDTTARGAMFLPIGDHGVFVAASREVAAFDEQRRHLVELLAATAEAAFDRLESEAGLRRREAELREQNRRLRQLQQVNDVIRDVDQTLVRAGSREEIERAVCERLTGEDRFRFAWIGDWEAETEVVAPRVWAGTGEAYLDVVDFDLDAAVPEPSASAAASMESAVAAPVTEYLQTSPWVSRALDHEFQVAVSVPIVYRDALYGVLSVYDDDPAAFDEGTTAVLSELGETIAYAIDASETKRGLLATDRTEIELRIEDPATVINEMAGAVETTVTAVDTTPQADGVSEVVFDVPDVPAADIETLPERLVFVESVRAVADQDGRYAATVSGDTLASSVVELGAVPQSIEATADETRLVVSLLPHVDVRSFVERLRDRFGGTELLARRVREGTGRSRSGFFEEFEELVTDRQLEVLRTAYERGYFETPRESSGQDVADGLGVSQPTVNHHLRESQRRLLSLLFGERDGDGEERG